MSCTDLEQIPVTMALCLLPRCTASASYTNQGNMPMIVVLAHLFGLKLIWGNIQ